MREGTSPTFVHLSPHVSLSRLFLVEARNIERVKPLVQCPTHSTTKNPSEFAILSLASSPIYTTISRYNGGAGAVEEWVRRTLKRTSTTPTLVLLGWNGTIGKEGKLDQILDDKGQKTHEGFRTTGLDQDWQIWTFHKRALVIPALVCSRWSLASQGGTKPN